MKVQLCILLLLAFAGSIACGADPDDWAAELGAREPDEDGGSGVVGMSALELEAYGLDEADDGADDEEVPESFIRNRRRVVIREMKFDSDWDCDPTAIPSVAYQFERLTGMEAQALVPNTPLTFDSPDIFDFPLLYMSAHYAFKFSDEEAKGLRTFVERGGFLLVDDCLYGQTFGPAFQGEMQQIFPETEMKEIDPEDPVNGIIFKQKFKFSGAHESGVTRSARNANPWSGIWLDGILGVVYTPQDFGCGWEISSPPTPSNPLGAGMHGADLMPGWRLAAYQTVTNVILFALIH